MYTLRIQFVDAPQIEKSAAYSHKISFWLFDSWQRRSDVICVELFDVHGKQVALIDKREQPQ
jgi:hypothetical protein